MAPAPDAQAGRDGGFVVESALASAPRDVAVVDCRGKLALGHAEDLYAVGKLTAAAAGLVATEDD